VTRRDLKPRGFAWVVASLVLVSIAQLSLKYAMEQLPGEPGFSAYVAALSPAYFFPVLLPIMIGMGCYGLSVFCWLGSLMHLPLSVAYPLLSLSYLLVSLAATLVFHESLDAGGLAGIALLILGSFFVALPARERVQ